jgi:hypothetical protein
VQSEAISLGFRLQRPWAMQYVKGGVSFFRTSPNRESLVRAVGRRILILFQSIFVEGRIAAAPLQRSKVAAHLRFLLRGAGHGPSIRLKTPPSSQEVLACELWT